MGTVRARMIAIVFLPYILRFQASPKLVHFPIKETVEHLAASTYITRFQLDPYLLL